MSGARIGPAALVVGLLLLTAGAAWAGQLTHRVRAGESASSLAKHYYGDHELAAELLQYNGKDGTVIHEGEVLRIPYCDEHRVGRGDAWSTLSQRYLGRPDLYRGVARLNGLSPAAPLQVGQSIVFPVALPYELGRGDTLALLAKRVYGDPARGDVLAEFNRIEDPRRLVVGETISVPLLSLRLKQDRPPAPPAAGEAPRTASVRRPTDKPVVHKAEAELEKPPVGEAVTPLPPAAPTIAEAPRPRFTDALTEASRSTAAGDFERARQQLEKLRGPIEADGVDEDRAELWRLLTEVYVAFDRQTEACAAHRRLARLDDAPWSDELRVSPKIREATSRCMVSARANQ